MLEFDAGRFAREFSKELAPRDTLPLGQVLRIHTQDCYTGQIKADGSVGPSLGPNPATGPFFVEGARPGDTLVVEVLDIGLPAYGIMRVREGLGAMQEVIQGHDARVLPIQGGKTCLNGVWLPLAPMIGVIGVAPGGAAVDNDTPGRHGGNMDDRRIGPGARVYLPVAVEGALFGLGDLHAQMGDGEVAICGLEVAGYVDLRLSLLHGRQEEWPVVERDGSFSINCSAKTLDEAARLARYGLHRFLQSRTKLDANTVAMLQSLVCDLSVCQLVDPLVTVRMALRSGVLDIAF